MAHTWHVEVVSREYRRFERIIVSHMNQLIVKQGQVCLAMSEPK